MNNYLALKEKLMSNLSENTPIQNLTETEKKLQSLITKFSVASDQKEIDKMLNEKLVNQYEERKENITFATLIKKSKNNFVVSLIIFDTDFTYSNVFLKEYESLENATEYFNHLKNSIQTMDISSLSLYIHAGLACFADSALSEENRIFFEQWEKENPGKNKYLDYFATLFKESCEAHPEFQNQGTGFLEWKLPKSGKRTVLFSSGMGDGVYSGYWGLDTEGETISLTVVFMNPEYF